jgi:hypothetical protein
MANRQTDTKIWSTQRWFKKLHPSHKLAWKYLTDVCDHAGIWKIDFGQLVDDTGLEDFDLTVFINACNQDFDKENGEKISRERIKIVNKRTVWLTGFIRFQYENKDFMINPEVPAINSALTILKGYGILEEGLSKGYYTLTKPYIKRTGRTIDIDKDIPKDESVGGAGEKREGGRGIGPDMVRVFKDAFPDYPVDQTLDYGACIELAYKIATSKNWTKESVVNGKQSEVLVIWAKIVAFVKSDKWFSTRSLSDINKEYQRLIQSIKTDGAYQQQPGKSNPRTAGVNKLLKNLKDNLTAGGGSDYQAQVPG